MVPKPTHWYLEALFKNPQLAQIWTFAKSEQLNAPAATFRVCLPRLKAQNIWQHSDNSGPKRDDTHSK